MNNSESISTFAYDDMRPLSNTTVANNNDKENTMNPAYKADSDFKYSKDFLLLTTKFMEKHNFEYLTLDYSDDIIFYDKEGGVHSKSSFVSDSDISREWGKIHEEYQKLFNDYIQAKQKEADETPLYEVDGSVESLENIQNINFVDQNISKDSFLSLRNKAFVWDMGYGMVLNGKWKCHFFDNRGDFHVGNGATKEDAFENAKNNFLGE